MLVSVTNVNLRVALTHLASHQKIKAMILMMLGTCLKT